MMKRWLAKVTLLFAVLSVSISASAQNIKCTDLLNKTWVNQLKSKMVVEKCDDKSGTFEGTYQSPSGTAGQKFGMRGVFNQMPQTTGDNVTVISFTVRWNVPGPPPVNFGSITAWNGILRPVSGAPTITAQWFLSRSNSSFEWDHILTGQDTFKPEK